MQNEYAQFLQSDAGSLFDREMEKKLDQFIQQKVGEGLEDDEILSQFQQSMLGPEDHDHKG